MVEDGLTDYLPILVRLGKKLSVSSICIDVAIKFQGFVQLMEPGS